MIGQGPGGVIENTKNGVPIIEKRLPELACFIMRTERHGFAHAPHGVERRLLIVGNGTLALMRAFTGLVDRIHHVVQVAQQLRAERLGGSLKTFPDAEAALRTRCAQQRRRLGWSR